MSASFTTDGLLESLKQAYDQSTWHGPNLCEALSGITLLQVLWRPAPERHNIWELVLHCAFWKHVVIRWLEGYGDEEGFLRRPKDFPALPEATEANWQADVELLKVTHETLLERVRAFDKARLGKVIEAGNERSFADLILGVANHDIYHAGQIRLLRVLQGEGG